jgi:glycosyltransferase involved in cell wall biosynthesis
VLDSLRAQTVGKDRWELLLIDNSSKQPLADSWNLAWHPNARHILEPELGLAAARRRGMREASSDLVVFVDDDNVVDLNYLSESLRIKEGWPQLGVWGSASILPEYEVTPPAHLTNYLPLLALRNTQQPRWGNFFVHNGALCKEAMPWGAGLCVRGNIALAYMHFYDNSSIQIADRCGQSLASGGDVEICLVACKEGLGMGIFPELRLLHLISKERLTDEYFLRLREGMALTDLLLANKWLKQVPETSLSVAGLAGYAKNVLTRRGIDRRMYLAYRRAAVSARKVIAANKG